MNTKTLLVRIAILVLLATILLGLTMWFHADLEDCNAIDPYKWPERCIDSARNKAKAGDRPSMSALFYALDKPSTAAEAVTWLQLAAARGDVEAYRFLLSLCGTSPHVTRKAIEQAFAEGKRSDPIGFAPLSLPNGLSKCE